MRNSVYEHAKSFKSRSVARQSFIKLSGAITQRPYKRFLYEIIQPLPNATLQPNLPLTTAIIHSTPVASAFHKKSFFLSNDAATSTLPNYDAQTEYTSACSATIQVVSKDKSGMLECSV